MHVLDVINVLFCHTVIVTNLYFYAIAYFLLIPTSANISANMYRYTCVHTNKN